MATTDSPWNIRFGIRPAVLSHTDVQVFIKPCFTMTKAETFEPSFGMIIPWVTEVGNVVLRIAARLNISHEHLRLSRAGVPMLDDDLLAFHNIVEEDTIECLFRAGGGNCTCCTPAVLLAAGA